jgi:hypothetical protein
MKDTPAAIERKFRRMLMKRSGEERLKMGCSMHATARALATAFLSQEYPGSDPAKLGSSGFCVKQYWEISPPRRGGPSAAKPQPKHGLSLARTQSAQSSEIKNESLLSKALSFTFNLGAFAPWREKIPTPSALKLQ